MSQAMRLRTAATVRGYLGTANPPQLAWRYAPIPLSKTMCRNRATREQQQQRTPAAAVTQAGVVLMLLLRLGEGSREAPKAALRPLASQQQRQASGALPAATPVRMWQSVGSLQEAPKWSKVLPKAWSAGARQCQQRLCSSCSVGCSRIAYRLCTRAAKAAAAAAADLAGSPQCSRWSWQDSHRAVLLLFGVGLVLLVMPAAVQQQQQGFR